MENIYSGIMAHEPVAAALRIDACAALFDAPVISARSCHVIREDSTLHLSLLGPFVFGNGSAGGQRGGQA